MAEKKLAHREVHNDTMENLAAGTAVATGMGYYLAGKESKEVTDARKAEAARRSKIATREGFDSDSKLTGIKPRQPGRIRSFVSYLVDPDKDPIAKITALKGEYAVKYEAIDVIDKSVRTMFNTATSMAEGTYKFTNSVINNILNPAIREGVDHFIKAEDTLIGNSGRGSAAIFNYVDEARKQAIEDYRSVTQRFAGFLVDDPNAFSLLNEDLYVEGARVGIKSAKEKVLKMLGFNFAVKKMVENGIQLDIETGGTLKDSPILQIGIGRMDQLKQIRDFTQEISALTKGIVDTTAIDKMSAEEQMAKGFLSLQLIPEAILRDTGQGLDPNGMPRETKFQAFSYIPRSVEEFHQQFGEWAFNKEGYRIDEFYAEFADKDTGKISEETIQRLSKELETEGYIKLSNGVRFYSQRSGALYTSLMLKRAADEGATLFSANINFESFRVGKLLNYFIRNKTPDSPYRDPFQLAMYDDLVDYFASTTEELDKNKKGRSVDLLNAERELLERFGGEIEGQTDFRKGLLQASWRRHTKLNILDVNNYYYINAVNRLRATGDMNEMIKLFPMSIERVSKGLATFDQLDFNKMLYSGLMQTGFLPLENDIFSGSKIDWQSQSMLGLKELHLALDDSIKQGQLLLESKLPRTVSNVYNVYKAMDSGDIRDHIKSAFSMMDMITDPHQKAWFDFSKVFRDTKITVKDNLTNIVYGEVSDGTLVDPLTRKILEKGEGALSATEAMKRRNIDRELLRIHETVLGILGDKDSLFYNGEVTDASGRMLAPERGIVFHLGDKGPVRIAPGEVVPDLDRAFYLANEGIEPFNLGQLVGMTRHEMQRENGTSLFVSYRRHEYNLKEKILSRRQELINTGLSQADADAQIMQEVVAKYGETESIAGRGIDQEALNDRLQSLLATLPDAEKRREVLKQMFGAAKVGPGAGPSFEQSILEQLKDPINAIKKGIDNGSTFNIDRFKPVFNSLKSFAKFNKPSGSNLGAKIDDFKGQLKQKVNTIGNIKIEDIKKSPQRFVEMTFGLNSQMGEYVMKHAGRALGSMGVLGGVAMGVGLGYMVDDSSWKMTTGEILKMSGEERVIEDHGPREKGGNLSLFTQQFTGPVQYANEAGIALQAIDSSKVDYAVGDGDTVEIISKGFMGLGRKKISSVRVAGMDAPETAHEGGTGPGMMPSASLAKQYLTNVLSAKSNAMLAVGGRQTYGRSVGVVIDTEGTNYSYEMVNEGLASVLYREKPEEDLISQSAYNAAENVAKRKQSGMWSNPFYYGAQSGIAGAERTGWNKMTPANIRKFGFDKSPGTTEEQAIYAQDMASTSAPPFVPPMGDNSPAGPDSSYAQKKALMADMQITALANAMERNRGRGRQRR